MTPIDPPILDKSLQDALDLTGSTELETLRLAREASAVLQKEYEQTQDALNKVLEAMPEFAASKESHAKMLAQQAVEKSAYDSFVTVAKLAFLSGGVKLPGIKSATIVLTYSIENAHLHDFWKWLLAFELNNMGDGQTKPALVAPSLITLSKSFEKFLASEAERVSQSLPTSVPPEYIHTESAVRVAVVSSLPAPKETI
jgi:hypothetical protein